MRKETAIFYRGSRTFFVSSLFFPSKIRRDVFDLYSFLRLTDDYVDQVQPDIKNFYKLRDLWTAAINDRHFDTCKQKDDSTNLRIVKNMARLTKEYQFETDWTEAFFDSMESDLSGKKYKTLEEILQYTYGTAEVAGLMMAKVMGLKPEAAHAARMQGRAFQWINFIRDIAEDNELGRQYFPAVDLKRFNLEDLSRKTALNQPHDFSNFIHFQIERYEKWQSEAEEGYKFIPKRFRISVQTASDVYGWTAEQIRANPLVVYDKKLRPAKRRILGALVRNLARNH